MAFGSTFAPPPRVTQTSARDSDIRWVLRLCPKQLVDPALEARDDIFAGEIVIGVRVGRCTVESIDKNCLKFRIDDPDQADADLKIFVDLAIDRGGKIVGRQHFDSQIRRDRSISGLELIKRESGSEDTRNVGASEVFVVGKSGVAIVGGKDVFKAARFTMVH